MKKALWLLMILSCIALSPAVCQAGDRLTVSADAAQSGDGYSWDGHELVLEDYHGPAVAIYNDATITLKGENVIDTRGLGGITCYGKLEVDGKHTGSLKITSMGGNGICSVGSMKLQDMNIDITVDGAGPNLGIYVSPVASLEGNKAVFRGIAGTVTAIESDEPDSAAIYSCSPIEVADCEYDGNIIEFHDPEIPEFPDYSISSGEYRSFSSEEAFFNAASKAVIFRSNSLPRVRPANTIVKGERIPADQLFTERERGHYKKSGRAAKIQGSTVIGKRKGTATIISLDAGNDPISEKEVVVLGKPKLKFPKTVTFKPGDRFSAYDYFRTKDTKFTAADSWASSDPDVAEVDMNGTVTVYSAGAAKITATFGNVAATATLRIKDQE